MKHESLEKFLADARTYLGLDGVSVADRLVEDSAGQPRRELDPITPERWRVPQFSEQPRRSLD